MGAVKIRPGLPYAWYGPSVLITNNQGECGPDETLSGYFFRETRFLRELRLEINGQRPCVCAAAAAMQQTLAFNLSYPEQLGYSGGGSGTGGAEIPRDDCGIPHRALDLLAQYEVTVQGFDVSLRIANRTAENIVVDLAWCLGADYADVLEALEGRRQQEFAVSEV